MGRQNIPDYLTKCKRLIDEWVGEWGLIAIVFLTALGSFGLGRLSALTEGKPPVSVMQGPEKAAPAAIVMGGLVVASWSGTVYYYPWCSGAGKIAPQNQRWFSSEDAARAAGYAPAKNCKGLVSQ